MIKHPIITASHIEEPQRSFLVSFLRPAYFNVLNFPPAQRIVNIMAETPAGAIEIAKYHWCNATDISIVGINQ